MIFRRKHIRVEIETSTLRLNMEAQKPSPVRSPADRVPDALPLPAAEAVPGNEQQAIPLPGGAKDPWGHEMPRAKAP
jgi:hypothetical protein